MRAAWLISLLGMLTLLACDKNAPQPIEYHYNYQPMVLGQRYLYQVDSIRFSDVALQDLDSIIIDSIRYQIEERWTDSFHTADGRVVYRLERRKRYSDTSAWFIDRVWSAYRDAHFYVKNEDDKAFRHLSFPIQRYQEWDGNALFAQDNPNDLYSNWTYETVNTHFSTSIMGANYDSLSHIVGIDEENVIEKTYSEHYFALGIGLVYSELQVLEKQDVVADWDEPESGFILRHRLLEYQP